MKVTMTFYNVGQHCRKTPPYLSTGKYRPHLLVKGTTDYLGVCFLDGEEVVLGKAVKGIAEYSYDGENYHLLQPNADFFIYEGGNKVGEGTVLERWAGKHLK